MNIDRLTELMYFYGNTNPIMRDFFCELPPDFPHLVPVGDDFVLPLTRNGYIDDEGQAHTEIFALAKNKCGPVVISYPSHKELHEAGSDPETRIFDINSNLASEELERLLSLGHIFNGVHLDELDRIVSAKLGGLADYFLKHNQDL